MLTVRYPALPACPSCGGSGKFEAGWRDVICEDCQGSGWEDERPDPFDMAVAAWIRAHPEDSNEQEAKAA
jgi:DnaJ-class molecular chaperone